MISKLGLPEQWAGSRPDILRIQYPPGIPPVSASKTIRCCAGGMSGSSAISVPEAGTNMRGRPPKRWTPEPGSSVPTRNHSSRAGSMSLAKITWDAMTPSGGDGGWLGTVRCNQAMTSSQIGAAPVMPLTLCIGSPERLPTQTPTVSPGSYRRFSGRTSMRSLSSTSNQCGAPGTHRL